MPAYNLGRLQAWRFPSMKWAKPHVKQALSNVYTMSLNAGFAEDVSKRKDTL